jgi:hypothetical protein
MSDYAKLLRELLVFEAMGLLPLEALNRLREQWKGTRELRHRAVGRLVHPGGGIPLRGLEVELWDRDMASQNDFLGVGVTDSEGRFEITYDPADAGLLDAADLELRIFEAPQQFQAGGVRRVRRVQVARYPGPEDVRSEQVDFGTVELAFYEYDPAVDFPYTHKDSLLRPFVPGAAARFFGSLSKWGAPHDALTLQLRLGRDFSVDEVQERYPETPTLKMEREQPGSSRSDEWFTRRLFDGFFPAIPEVDAAGDLWVRTTWGAFEMTGHLDLPDYAVRFVREGDQLAPRQIRLQFRVPGQNAPGGAMQEALVFSRPDSNADPEVVAAWQAAKRLVRVCHNGVVGQLLGHVAVAHFNMEQYALAM